MNSIDAMKASAKKCMAVNCTARLGGPFFSRDEAITFGKGKPMLQVKRKRLMARGQHIDQYLHHPQHSSSLDKASSRYLHGWRHCNEAGDLEADADGVNCRPFRCEHSRTRKTNWWPSNASERSEPVRSIG